MRGFPLLTVIVRCTPGMHVLHVLPKLQAAQPLKPRWSPPPKLGIFGLCVACVGFASLVKVEIRVNANSASLSQQFESARA